MQSCKQMSNVRERVEVVEPNKRWFPPFSFCPVSQQCLWKKTLIEKNKKILKLTQNLAFVHLHLLISVYT